MNETTPTETLKQPTAKKPRRVSKPRQPRTIDPGVAAIHAEAKAKVASYRNAKRSQGILETIITKRLVQMTEDHKQQLFDVLSKTCTPALIPPTA
ncbi:MAG: hypothetical protein WC655_05695 [Candidatus Hydrogenedentales bacterium]|jgi:hypothetical protein